LAATTPTLSERSSQAIFKNHSAAKIIQSARVTAGDFSPFAQGHLIVPSIPWARKAAVEAMSTKEGR